MAIAAGCQKRQQTPQKPLPAIGVELSSVKGVSIIRRAETESAQESWVGFEPSQSNVSRVTAKNKSLFDILVEVYNGEGLTFHDDTPLPDGIYDVTIECKDSANGPWPMLKDAYEKAFSVRFRGVKELTEVYVLIRDKEKKLTLAPTKETRQSWGMAKTPDGYGYNFKVASIDNLVEVLQKYTDAAVFNGTGINGNYSFYLTMDHWKPESVFPGVEKLGLKLVKEKRMMEGMHIEAKGKGPSAASTSAPQPQK